MKHLSLIIILSCSFGFAYSQAPTVQDCAGAIPICQNIYSNSVSYSGDGNYTDVNSVAGSCVAGEYNTVWYIFTAQTTGNFVFTITPVNNADDYDWAVYDLTNNTCADIASGALLPVSCNSYGSLSGYNGPTGVSTVEGGTDNSNGPGDLNGPPWNSDMPVLAGNTYVMMVDNWTSSVFGYTINFSSSTATIFDNIPPSLDSITSTISCNTGSLTIKFSEKVLTSTVSVSDFTLTGPGGPYSITSITPATGAAGATQEVSFNLNFSPTVQMNGVYSLNLVGPVTDLCGNVATLGLLSFTVTSIPGPPSTQSNSPICPGDTLLLTAQSIPGATFNWTGPMGFVSGMQNPVISGFASNQAGAYLVTASFNGCTSEPAVVSVAIQNSNLNVNLGNDTILCSDVVLLLNASNNNSLGDVSYLWHNSFSSTTSTAATFLANKPGNYWVLVSDFCGSDTDTITIAYNDMELDLGLNQSNICNTSPVILDASTPLSGYSGVSYFWSTGETVASITAISAGDYSVTVSRGLCVERDTVTISFVSPLQVTLGPDVLICQGSPTLLSPGSFPFASYLWSTGAATQNLVVTNPGNYIVSVTNGCGTFSDLIQVGIQTPPSVNLGADTAICAGNSISFSAQYPGLTYFWSTGQSQPAIMVSQAGVYSVTVTGACGSANDQVMVSLQNPINIELGTDTTVCPGFILHSGINNGQVFWSTGETTSSIIANTSDFYMVEASNQCGTFNDEIFVEVLTIEIELGPDISACQGQIIALNAQNNSSEYLWSTGQTTAGISVISTGNYAVTVSNFCGTETDEILIDFFDPALNIGPDTSICEGEEIMLDAGHTGSMYVWSNGQNTQSISTGQAGAVWVTLSNPCGQLSDTLQLSVIAIPQPDFGADTLYFNQGQSLLLTPGNSFTNYFWSTGETSSEINVSTPGLYSVSVENEAGCSASDSVIIALKTGFDNSLVSTFRLVNDEGFIRIISDKIIYKLLIINILGQSLSYNPDSFDFTVPVFASGFHILKIEFNDRTSEAIPVILRMKK